MVHKAVTAMLEHFSNSKAICPQLGKSLECYKEVQGDPGGHRGCLKEENSKNQSRFLEEASGSLLSLCYYRFIPRRLKVNMKLGV